MAIHKGSELNNIKETWEQNERMRQTGKAACPEDASTGTGNNLEQAIKEEAAEYDNANKEDRLLSGERATVRDDEGNKASGD